MTDQQGPELDTRVDAAVKACAEAGHNYGVWCCRACIAEAIRLAVEEEREACAADVCGGCTPGEGRLPVVWRHGVACHATRIGTILCGAHQIRARGAR